MPCRIGLSSRATSCEERVKVDWCSSGFTPRLLVILFTTEGAEHTEKMIKNMFYLLCLLCVARSASVYSVVRMFCRRGFMPRKFDFKVHGQRATGCERRVKIDWCRCEFIPHLLVILFTTEGTEHTEEMIKDMFYLLCLLCVARPRCTLW